ncbi:MAG TPA: CHASE domain-containing protein [Gemmatimonadaceae bacterium]|nr:CHASE domain-containing protein [Gemmatimonadaceae bacterium]
MPPRRRTPFVVLATSLALTAVASTIVAVSGRRRDVARFQNAVDATASRIEARFENYVTMLRAGNGLFTASGTVTDREFRTFVELFDLAEDYPGVRGIGFAERVPAAALDSLVAARRAAGDRTYRVWPDTARAVYYPIVYLEPRDWRNERAVGYDMYTDPTRRRAMARARDEGTPILSGMVRLVQEVSRGQQPGFLIYDPVYDSDRVPPTVAERRARLRGFVYAPFRAGDLFTGIFGRAAPTVAFRVYDDTVANPARLLYDSRARGSGIHAAQQSEPAFEDSLAFPILGNQWTIVFTSLPAVEERSGHILAPAIAVAGLLLSLLLYGLTRAEVRARAEAERSERARGRFFAAMSHELRTPLNAIIGYNDLLLAGVYGDLPDSQRTGIERSQRAARHLHELVNDVLDLSKLEADKLELDEAPVAVPQLVDELFSTLHGLAVERGSELRLACDGDVPTVDSDPRRVRQILLNLLSNAIKFGEGRPVVVRCGPLPHGGVRVAVTDHGSGISPADQERIFEEFVQLPSAATGGTGLGLPISRRLAHLLGGALHVTSAVGQGSTFTLDLPARLPGR